MADPSLESLKPPEARALARKILEDGVVEFTGHAVEEMANDGLQSADCINLLRAGVFSPAEYTNREWRYRVSTSRICVVIAFASTEKLMIVTAWRVKG